jgi:hypothetical protein
MAAAVQWIAAQRINTRFASASLPADMLREVSSPEDCVKYLNAKASPPGSLP